MQKKKFVKGFIYLSMLLIIGFLIPNYARAEDSELPVDSFSGLVIDEDIVNDADSMIVNVLSSDIPKNRIGIYKVKTGERGGYNHSDGSKIRRNIHSEYVPGSGKVYIEFEDVGPEETLNNTVIQVTYPEIGYMETKNLERKKVGVILTISNFNKKMYYKKENKGIDLSTNLFSGMYLYNMSSADWQFQFFDVETKQLINFEGDNELYDESSMAFNSLNGYSNDWSNKGEHPEFVREIGGREAKLSKDSMVVKSTVKTDAVAGEYYTYEDVYHGSHNSFGDHLGSNNFHIASAQFPLVGDTNTFKIGTAFDAYTGWFSFSSAKIDAPYKHRVPMKTVQPLYQYKKEDLPGKPTGNESGFSERYWNDLDVYEPGNKKDGLMDYYKVKGHNPDKSEELAPGVPKKEERFVEVGDEFYYFINQRTTNLASDGIVLPTKYQLSDTLPKGITLADNPFTLYNLDGNILPLGTDYVNEKDDVDTWIDNQGRTAFDVKLNGVTSTKINNLARQYEYYGYDFSLRVKVKVTDEVNRNELQLNRASTTFTYFENTDEERVTQNSNKVGTRLRSTKIEFDKVNQDDKALPNAVFKIYEYDENKAENKGKLLDTKTSDFKGKVIFNYDFPPGKYVLEEFHAPGQYMLHEDVVIEVDDNLQVIWPDGLDGKIVNEKRYNLWLFKVDEHRNPLKGAKFELSGGDLDEPRIETSDKDGEIIFRAGPMFKGQTYELRELEAPAGYDKVDTVYKIEMSDDGLSANLIDGEGNKSPLKVELIEDVSKHNKVSGGIEIGIVNPRTKSTLEVIKEDKDSKKAIKDVSFKVFKEGENPDKAVEYTTDEQGKFTVPNLDTKETYFIRETKAPNDYILLDQDIVLSFDTKQNKWLVTEKDTGKELDAVKWDSQNNLLSVTIFNEQKKMLPQTGGSGIIIPLVISSLTGLGSLSYFIRVKRSEV